MYGIFTYIYHVNQPLAGSLFSTILRYIIWYHEPKHGINRPDFWKKSSWKSSANRSVGYTWKGGAPNPENIRNCLHPRRLTWNLRIQAPWKRKIIFQTIIFRFYVNLPGCIINISLVPYINHRESINQLFCSWSVIRNLTPPRYLPKELQRSFIGLWDYWPPTSPRTRASV